MDIQKTPLKGVFIIRPLVRTDGRGFFMEVYRSDAFLGRGIRDSFVQVNHTYSRRGVLRGLHFQWNPPLGKLIRVLRGETFMALLDIRKRSETFRQWAGFEVTADNKISIYAPQGIATGFCVTGECAEVEYHYSALYNPDGESAIRWDDKTINIAWPVAHPIVSPRDLAAQTFDLWLRSPHSDAF